MSRFKEIEDRLKKKLRVNVPTASDKRGYSRMVRAKEGDKEKLIYFGKKKPSQRDPQKSYRAETAMKCDTPMSKLTPEYWECQDMANRKEKGVQKFKKSKTTKAKKEYT